MNFRHAGRVYRKELLETLRDRRTILSMIVVPLFLIPALLFGMAKVSILLVERAARDRQRIMILGAENAPALAESLRTMPAFEVVPPAADYAARIEAKELRAAIEFPPNFENRLASGEPSSDLTVRLYHYEGEMRSGFAVRGLERVLRDHHDRLVSERLQDRGVPAELLAPFATEERNVASPQKVGGTVLGGIIPYVIILLALTGAMYPAIDLTAGEKERGTIETILASPVSRASLAAGKFLTVLTASFVTTVLSLASLAATMRFAPSLMTFGDNGAGGLRLDVGPAAVAGVLAMVLPVSILFSAALLAIALQAKSYKEAQSYISPLMIVVILPAVSAMLPGVELDTRLALVPILNVSLVCKEILSGTYHWDRIGLILVSSSVYALVALAVAARTFQRESVLFRS